MKRPGAPRPRLIGEQLQHPGAHPAAFKPGGHRHRDFRLRRAGAGPVPGNNLEMSADLPDNHPRRGR
ncbi:MAG: hypothetical protein AMXMBFR57_13590 [Acidimicrobiia bacterium]